MALSYNNYTGDGATTVYRITFDYIDISHIKVLVNGQQVVFTADSINQWVTLASAPAVDDVVRVYRFTPRDHAYTDFTRGNAFGQRNVNNSFLWQLYIAQEISEGTVSTELSPAFDMNMNGKQFINLGTATANGNAIEYGQWLADKTTQEGRLDILENTFLTGGAVGVTTWNYFAIGGESSVTLPFAFDNVRQVTINGLIQTKDYSWEWVPVVNDQPNYSITLAEEVLAGDIIGVTIGGDSVELINNIQGDISDLTVQVYPNTIALAIKDALASGYVNAKYFGATGNGATDDTPAIQAAIDFVLNYNNVLRNSTVYLPYGSYRTTKTLFMGYGDSFGTVNIVGSGNKYRPESLFGGTEIIADFSNAPAINFQGVRNSSIKSLSIVGKAYNTLKDNDAGGINSKHLRMQQSHYQVSGLASNAYSDTAPYCGICIDGWSGTQPATAYPTDTISYGKVTTNKPRFEDVSVQGFTVGVMCHPSGDDSQGDFLTLNNCTLAFNMYGLSIGNTQSRLVRIENSFIENCWYCIVNNRHGNKRGRLDALITSTSFDRSGYLMDIDGGITGNVTIENCYAELLGGLGYWCKSNNLDSSNLIFINGSYVFAEFETALGEESQGIPDYHIYNSGTGTVTFMGTTVNVEKFFITNGNVLPDKLKIVPRDVPAISKAFAAAQNSSGNMILNFDNRVPSEQSIYTSQYNLSTLAKTPLLNINTSYPKASKSGKNNLLPLSTTTIYYDNDAYAPAYGYWQQAYVDSNVITDVDDMNVKLVSQNLGTKNMMDVGDLVQCTTGVDVQHYVVTSKANITGGNTFECNLRRISGYRKDNGTYVKTSNNLTGTQVIHMITRLSTAESIIIGDLTFGSNQIKKVGRADGFFGELTGKIVVGDRLFITEQSYRPFFKSVTITSITTEADGSTTLTMDAPAQVTQERWVFPPIMQTL